ncbi:urease accessory protein UreD [Ralstonia solanacearum]|uniref:urease accessory protein UreD n=1 Tax=Ralstonia solanacearum TaxID=305 RepID=UPI0005AC2012|nr:urease accessory protein UreD [Ralstonia solanacearum]MDC6177569.1 urease accessory protein UreD [Ralstonia solanacearum]MDC6209962.1 urease accessory protein UreD [Ralstonia solanacearum]MDC6237720.1 urease accessory protein UreD [Ralstonia solanacearum]MDD7799675.1 urease accessory protein UreD [Ralstonia solanacearum]
MRHPDFPVPPRIDAFSSWEATLRLAFARRGERTVLASCRHQGPLRVQKALYPEGEGVCHVVLLHPPAGIAGGDVLDIGIGLGADAHAVLTTPGATKWYKSLGRTATQRVAIRLDAGARLDWLPQENIVFNQACPIIDLTLDLASGATAIGWDTTMLGRHAAGESWQAGHIAMHTRLRCEGQPLWIEAAAFDAQSPVLGATMGMAGFHVVGTLWAVGEGATEALAETLAEQLPYNDDIRAGATCLVQERSGRPNVLLLRVLARRPEAARALLSQTWLALREPIHSVAGRPLRLWAT